MGIYKVTKGKNKGKWRVLSYVTGKWHKKVYKNYLSALRAAGVTARKKYYKKKLGGKCK